MLSEQERERLVEEEKLRKDIRESLEKPKAAPSGLLLRVVASENFRWIATSMAIPLTVFLWGQYTQHQAEEDRKLAASEAKKEREQAAAEAAKERVLRQAIEVAHRNADLVIRLLPDLRSEAKPADRQNALSVIRSLESEGQLTPALRASLESNVEQLRQSVTPQGTFSSSEVRQEVEALGRSAPSSVEIESGTANASTIALPGTKVYLQIFTEDQRRSAEQIQRVARELGLAAPGVENVVAVAARANRKRPSGYDAPVLLVFRKSDEAIAKKLAEEVKRSANINLSVLGRWDRPSSKNVPTGQLEVWLTDPTRKQP